MRDTYMYMYFSAFIIVLNKITGLKKSLWHKYMYIHYIVCYCYSYTLYTVPKLIIIIQQVLYCWGGAVILPGDMASCYRGAWHTTGGAIHTTSGQWMNTINISQVYYWLSYCTCLCLIMLSVWLHVSVFTYTNPMHSCTWMHRICVLYFVRIIIQTRVIACLVVWRITVYFKSITL